MKYKEDTFTHIFLYLFGRIWSIVELFFILLFSWMRIRNVKHIQKQQKIKIKIQQTFFERDKLFVFVVLLLFCLLFAFVLFFSLLVSSVHIIIVYIFFASVHINQIHKSLNNFIVLRLNVLKAGSVSYCYWRFWHWIKMKREIHPNFSSFHYSIGVWKWNPLPVLLRIIIVIFHRFFFAFLHKSIEKSECAER